jgi:hypothetical protein
MKPNSNRCNWATAICTYRVVPPKEIKELTEETGCMSGPPKIPFNQAANRESREVNFQVITTKRRRSETPTEYSSSSESDTETDVDDYDFNPEEKETRGFSETTKSARRRIYTSGSSYFH